METMDLKPTEAALIRAIRELDEAPSNVWMAYVDMQESFVKTYEEVRGTDNRVTQAQVARAEYARELQATIYPT